ncbi:penicillin-binding protein 1A [Flavobacterium haoranii]|uniref:Penicillin-binding protein 1A n=1 Tax=Flavobacterium haoranii TaxID=683124 RepID=A0A1M6EWQ4_9FLAO|nr:transglycosylase domain-containing protein [Flavobacterium haoranii]SHI89809.1 penicillin-binding protein 1A [Flavobacterium haoranii]
MAVKKSENSDFSKYIKTFWKLFFGGVGFVILLFLFASWGLLGSMPSFEKLENPDSNIATEIISSDGEVIGKFYAENRVPVKFQDLPPHLVNALVATEDERFYEHSGIDGRGTVRAVVKLGTDGGASTITQQLAKLLFHGEGSKNIVMRILQKVKEWVIAVRLERQYTKQEILAMYLNEVDFLYNAVGIRSAAKIYFNKEPKDLTIEESAVLVGMLKNPSLYNPKKKEKNAFNRRNTVLGQMVKGGFITEAEKAKLSKDSIHLNFKPESHKEGNATYFREYLRDYMKKWVKDHPKEDGSEYDIYRDGLKIYVTIDSKMQQYAEEAVAEHMPTLQNKFFDLAKTNKNAPFLNITTEETDRIMNRAMKSSERWRLMKDEGKSEDQILKSFDVKTEMKIFTWKGERDTIMTPRDSIRYYKHFLQTGMMAMEPQTGQIKAWVGGINYKYFQYDHVGQGARQVGSTFKPFVYSTAIEQLGMSPCDSIIDGPFTMPKGKWGIDQAWSPRNSDGKFRGMITLKQALANSVNTVSAKLMDRVGPKSVVDMVHDLGVTSEIPARPAIALGAVEITVEEMVGAFSTFANQGVYVKPTFITRIEDKNGVVLDQIVPESKDVMNRDVAYAIVKLLEGVTESGTGQRLRWGGVSGLTQYKYAFTNPIAGKTGTSQNNSDGWFMGMVPNLVAGVWVGNEDRSAHFRQTLYGQGATMALPIWGLFMDKCYKDENLTVSRGAFERPKDLSIKVDCWKKEVDTTAIDEPDLEEFDF